MRCVIIEDSPHDMELLSFYAAKEPGLELLQSFPNALEAISYLNKQQPQLLFLDIDIPLLKGIDLPGKLIYTPISVFVTAHAEYALASYEAQAFDFILKPLTEDRFNRCITRLYEYAELQKRADLYDALFETKSILLKEGTTSYRIPLKDILYVEALNDYSKVVTKTKKYITLSKLKHFLEKLPSEDFIRIHRSYAVAKPAIETISATELKIAGQQLPIGKTYRLNLKKELI